LIVFNKSNVFFVRVELKWKQRSWC